MPTTVIEGALIGALAALCIIAVARKKTRAVAPAPVVTERAEAVMAPTDVVTATHEAGHAVLAWVSPYVAEVTAIELKDEGESGVTSMSRGAIDSPVRLWDAIAISLAGIAAEGYAFGRFSTRGSRGDLAKARAWAETLVATTPDAARSFPWKAPLSRSVIDVGKMFEERPSEEVCDVLNAAYRHAKSVFAVRPAAFHALAGAIHARRRLTAADVEAVLGPRPWAIFAPKT